MKKNYINYSFRKAVKTYKREAVIQRHTAERLVLLNLKYINKRNFSLVFEAGMGTGFLTSCFLKNSKIHRYHANEMDEVYKSYINDLEKLYINTRFTFLKGDIESKAFFSKLDKNYDIIISNAVFQWIENKDFFFRKIGERVKKNGYLSFTTFGEKNFYQIKDLTKKGLKYLSLYDYMKLLEQDFKILYAEEEIIDSEFSMPVDVIKHIKDTGSIGYFSTLKTLASVVSFIRGYKRKYSKTNGKVYLTYHPLYIIAKKK